MTPRLFGLAALLVAQVCLFSAGYFLKSSWFITAGILVIAGGLIALLAAIALHVSGYGYPLPFGSFAYGFLKGEFVLLAAERIAQRWLVVFTLRREFFPRVVWMKEEPSIPFGTIFRFRREGERVVLEEVP